MEDKLYPIYGLWHKPFWQAKTFYTIIAVFFLIVVSFLVWLLIRRYLAKRRKKNPWDIALADLGRIQVFLARGKLSHQDFYLGLTALLKSYFYARFGYNLFGKTDQEVLAFLKKEKFDDHLLYSMEQMLEGLQFVKFANGQAVKEKMEQDIQRCSNIIQKTVPVK